jgi:hypothetical protein
MPPLRSSGTRQTADPMQTLMVYVYEGERKIGPRHATYEVSFSDLATDSCDSFHLKKATIDLCRRMFSTLPIQHPVKLHTKDLNICDGQLAEIYPASWETVVNHAMEVVVKSETPVIRDVAGRESYLINQMIPLFDFSNQLE